MQTPTAAKIDLNYSPNGMRPICDLQKLTVDFISALKIFIGVFKATFLFDREPQILTLMVLIMWKPVKNITLYMASMV